MLLLNTIEEYATIWMKQEMLISQHGDIFCSNSPLPCSITFECWLYLQCKKRLGYVPYQVPIREWQRVGKPHAQLKKVAKRPISRVTIQIVYLCYRDILYIQPEW